MLSHGYIVRNPSSLRHPYDVSRRDECRMVAHAKARNDVNAYLDRQAALDAKIRVARILPAL